MLFCKQILVTNKWFRWKTYSDIAKMNLSFAIQDHFPDKNYDLHLLNFGPEPTIEISKEASLKYFRQMNIIRKFEATCADLYRKHEIRGFCHLCIGQEAVAVGINSALRAQDTVVTSYRCHAWACLKCDSLTSVFGEMLGLQSGVARGKGGSMHLYGHNFFGGNGIVGAHVPLGVGIALKHKYTGSDAISVVLYGDGAASQGQVTEGYNMAKLHNLPVIFVIENNNYGMATPVDKTTANPELFKHCSYIPGLRTNGNEILAVLSAINFAYDHVLSGKGPIILEMMTYRYHGHSMSDPGTSYRTRDEIKLVRDQKDPVKNFKILMLQSNLADQDEIKKIHKETEAEVKDAVAKALKTKPPPLEELTSDIYSHYDGPVRTTKMLKYKRHKNIVQFFH